MGGYDACVVGAGIVGLMCAYHLARKGFSVGVFEALGEPGLGVTAGQSEVIHVVQPPLSSLKSRLAREGNRMYDELCAELGVRLLRLPALLVVRRLRDIPALVLGYLYLKFRGGFKLGLARGDTLRRIEPSLSPDVVAGIVVWGYGVVDSKALVLSLRERLESMGVAFHFGCEVYGARGAAEGFTLTSSCGEHGCRSIVNAAGLQADLVAERLGVSCGRITPALGVMAEFSGPRLNAIVAPFSLRQKGRTKGGGIIPTVRGTYLFGPTFRVLEDRRLGEIPEEDVRVLVEKFSPLISHKAKPIRVYAGIRPLSPTGDFVIAQDRTGRIVSLVGIESPGLTAAPALGLLVANMLCERLKQ